MNTLNSHPKVFIDNNGKPLQTGSLYKWMDEEITADSFQEGVIYFSNGIQIHYSEFINESDIGLPIKCS